MPLAAGPLFPGTPLSPSSPQSLEENRKIQERLFEESEIAVHYEDICSLNHRKYQEDNQRKIKRFRELYKEGGFVCAEYPVIKRMRIGVVESGGEFQPD